MMNEWLIIVNSESINQSNFIAPISPLQPGSLARQPSRCSTKNSMKQFCNINRPSGVLVCMGERASPRDVSLIETTTYKVSCK